MGGVCEGDGEGGECEGRAVSGWDWRADGGGVFGVGDR